MQNVNDKRTSLVLGEREKVLYGPGYIVDELCGCRFRISAKSFYQINPVQTEVLYSKAMEFAGAHRQGEGAGRLLRHWHHRPGGGPSTAARCWGGAEPRRGRKDAIQNARENGMKNAWFTCGDAGEFLEEAALERERWDVVFMDPPSPALRLAGCPLPSAGPLPGPGRAPPGGGPPPGGGRDQPGVVRPQQVVYIQASHGTWASFRPYYKIEQSSQWTCFPPHISAW